MTYWTIFWISAPDYCETIAQTYIHREQSMLTTMINDGVMDNVYRPTVLPNVSSNVSVHVVQQF